ncbi:MAG TPA: cupin domain-containing protein [Oscillatoriales cyanobacterium M59_W2019_021]|nr:MAG: cupin domain-containing protein [Cyanobacteria bacterium J055]HIK33665.1 cupin domain-containing protein [Oscillatoriales cyanobacterium M4454_W2019_049]HIK52667.1 cupin domain-containing protein [Oscillatoriales cyanobacterium M59_W2019_021]
MNIFHLPSDLPQEEYFEPLLSQGNLLIERIISTGQTTPPGEWYDQDRDEWVVLLQGEATLGYEDGSTKVLTAGDWVLISAHQKHRVEFTSTQPPCIWLAVHVAPSINPQS